MKFAILFTITLATASAWAVDDMTCMTMGKPAYDQMANNGHIDAKALIQASGLSNGDIRTCLEKASARIASKQIGDLNPNILRKTIGALRAALGGGEGGSHVAAKAPHHAHSVSAAAASR